MTSRSEPRVSRLFRCGSLRSATLGALACALSGVANAQTNGLELRWQAPPECPTAEVVHERIRALAGPTTTQHGQLKADATVTATGGRFRLKLALRSGNLVGERSLESDSCDALAGAAAVALALLLSSPEPLGERELSGAATASAGGAGGGGGAPPETTAAPAPEPPKTVVRQPPAVAAPAEESPAAAADSDSTSGFHWLVQAPLVTLDIGPLPRPSGGVALATGPRIDEWQFLLGAQVTLPQTIPADGFTNVSARVWRAAAEAWVCRGFRGSGVELSPCLLLAIERASVTGEGEYVITASEQVIWFSGGAGLLGRWYALDSVALVVGASGRIEASRPQIEITGLGTIARFAPAAVSFRIGSEWIW